MTKVTLFWILWMILGNPVLALLVLVVGFFLLDRVALGLLPPIVGAWLNVSRAARLSAAVAANPHDRPARRAFAELCVQRRQFAKAGGLLEPVLTDRRVKAEAGAFLVGAEAWLGAGDLDRAGACVEAAREGARTNQYYDVSMLTGRILEAAGRLPEAAVAYAEAVDLSQGRVEPRVRWWRVLRATGETQRALEVRRSAWQAYREAPFFQQRQERRWAWRANPARPLAYLAVLFGVGLALSVWIRPHAEEARAVPVRASTGPGR